MESLKERNIFQFCYKCQQTRQEIHEDAKLECGHEFDPMRAIIGGQALTREEAEARLRIKWAFKQPEIARTQE